MDVDTQSSRPVSSESKPESDAKSDEASWRGGRGGHFAWLDLRECDERTVGAYVEAALHHGIGGIVSDDPALLAGLPPTIDRVLFPREAASTGLTGAADSAVTADLVIVPAGPDGRTSAEPAARATEVAPFVRITDKASLDLGCALARTRRWTVLSFADPTKIPLEIVIAAAHNAAGRTVTVVGDLAEAQVVLGCLESGSDGVQLAPRELSDVPALAALLIPAEPRVNLVELTVTGTRHLGMGDRACLDVSSLLGEDEGLLVGSFAEALVLTCSETHPLPYMPTRPFRVNAAAVHSYVLSPGGRTNYLTELASGAPVLAVRVDGSTRRLALGRVKIESRPLLGIDLSTPDGTAANIVVQDDWHVRLLGPGGRPNNVTELKPGDALLGYLPRAARHVGWPIREFCLER